MSSGTSSEDRGSRVVARTGAARADRHRRGVARRAACRGDAPPTRVRAATWWWSVPNRTVRTTGRHCRRSCCRASGSPTASTSASPTSFDELEVHVAARDGGRATRTRRPRTAARLARRCETLDFDGMIIATGAAPKHIGDHGPYPHVHVLRSLDDALAVRAATRGGRRARRGDRCRLHRPRGRGDRACSSATTSSCSKVVRRP